MLLVALPKYVLWPALDWAVALLDTAFEAVGVHAVTFPGSED
jgi:hypothetical protein